MCSLQQQFSERDSSAVIFVIRKRKKSLTVLLLSFCYRLQIFDSWMLTFDTYLEIS
jgi:hypothetical protein